MRNNFGSAVAFANIALIKYWGNCDHAINLPANSSISMNLKQLSTQINLEFSHSFLADSLIINQLQASENMRSRASNFLDHVRKLAGSNLNANIISTSNIPMGTGLASSAAAFAALSLAASQALGLGLSESELSRLARLGSGSACRSVPSGFVEWRQGTCDQDSYASSIASPGHWDLWDCIAIISTDHKKIGSHSGHISANTSLFQEPRIVDSQKRVDICRKAIMEKNFPLLAETAELDSNMMHAVMLTTRPPLIYMAPKTLEVIQQVPLWRDQGLPVFYTLDAGPNVHLICPANYQYDVQLQLIQMGIETIILTEIGGPAHILDDTSTF